MSAEAKTICLDATVFAALQEAAARQHKTLDEMASEAVMAGLKTERLSLVEALLAKGHQYGVASGISEQDLVDVIHADRAQRKRMR